MFYIIYQTTNLINGKKYIGKHRTNNLEDGYLGSGSLLMKAIQKYGKENFERKILYFCSSEKEMNQKESEIVNEEFLKRKDIYNLSLGGRGSWDYLNKNKLNNTNFSLEGLSKWRNSLTKEEVLDWKQKVRDGLKKSEKHKDSMKNRYRSGKYTHPWLGKNHKEESKEKIRNSLTGKCVGALNHRYGKIWVWNPNCNEEKFINKEELEEQEKHGWIKGRKRH